MTGEATSQEEIDTRGGSDPDLLTPDTAPERAPAHDAVPVETPTPTLLVSATSSPNSDLAQRLASLEATVAALQNSAADGENDAAILALTQQVEALTAQVTELGAQLQDSLASVCAVRFNVARVARRGRSVLASRACSAGLSLGSAGRSRAPRRCSLANFIAWVD